MTAQGAESSSREFVLKIENKIKSKKESDESIIEDLASASENELSDLYRQTFDSKGTLLHLTVKYRKYQLLEWLLNQNITDSININAGDISNFTALHLAVINNSPSCARLLIKHRADPLHQDRRHRSAWSLYQDLISNRDPSFKLVFLHIELPDRTLLERSNNPVLIGELQERFSELALTDRSTDSSLSVDLLTDTSEHSNDNVFEKISLANQTKRNVLNYSSRFDSSSTLNSLSTFSIASSSSSSSSFFPNKILKDLLINPNVEEFRNYLISVDDLENKINGDPLIFHTFISTLNLAHAHREQYEQAFLQFTTLFNRTALSNLYKPQADKPDSKFKTEDDEGSELDAFLSKINKEHGFTATSFFKFISELRQYFSHQLVNIRSESFNILKENNDVLESFLIQLFGALKAGHAKIEMLDDISDVDNNETKLRKVINRLIKYDLKDLFDVSLGLPIPPDDLLMIIKKHYNEFSALEKCVSILIVKNIALHMLDCVELRPLFSTKLINKFLNMIIDDECFHNSSIETFFSYLLELPEKLTPLYFENINELNSWFLTPSIRQKLISFERVIDTAANCEEIKIQKKLIQIAANEIKALSLETLQSIKFSELKNGAWEKLKDSNISTYSRRFNNLSAFIVKQIVSKKENFVKYYAIWVRIANALLTPVEGLGPDLGAVLAILTALESRAVRHGKTAFPKIDSEFTKILEQLQNLCNPKGNYSNFSVAIQAYSNPLPYLGMILSQIIRAQDNDKLFDKILALGKIYYHFLLLQRSLYSYPIIRDSDLKEILDLPYPNLDDLYYLACQFVPFKIYLSEYEGDRVIGELKNCMIYSLEPQFIQNEKEIRSKDTFFELCRYVFSEIYFGRRTEDDLFTLAEYQKHCGINYSTLLGELSRWIFEKMRTQNFSIDKGMPLLYKYINALNPSIRLDWGTSVTRYSAANATSEETIYYNPLYIYRGAMQKLEEKKPDAQKSSSASSSSSGSIRHSRKRASSTLKRNLSSKGSTLIPKLP